MSTSTNGLTDAHYDKLAELELERGRIQGQGFITELQNAGLLEKEAVSLGRQARVLGRKINRAGANLNPKMLIRNATPGQAAAAAGAVGIAGGVALGRATKNDSPAPAAKIAGLMDSMGNTLGRAKSHGSKIYGGIKTTGAKAAAGAGAYAAKHKVPLAVGGTAVALMGVGAYRAGKGRRAEGAALGPAGLGVRNRLKKTAADGAYQAADSARGAAGNLPPVIKAKIRDRAAAASQKLYGAAKQSAGQVGSHIGAHKGGYAAGALAAVGAGAGFAAYKHKKKGEKTASSHVLDAYLDNIDKEADLTSLYRNGVTALKTPSGSQARKVFKAQAGGYAARAKQIVGKATRSTMSVVR